MHDNQSLGTGLLKIAASGMPVVATVHHPITRDRVLDLAAAQWWRKPLVHRWYGFAEMQKRVARQIPDLLTVSTTSATDIADDFGVHPDQLHVVPLGVDTSVFAPTLRTPGARPHHRDRQRRRATQGCRRTCCRRWRNCAPSATSSCNWWRGWRATGPTEKLIAELGIADIVHISSGLSDAELADLLASAEIACIPSLYEGFSLPAVEAMASGTPIVASRAGALPEVLGTEGLCAELVHARRCGGTDARCSAICSTPPSGATSWEWPDGSAPSTSTPGNPLRRRRSRVYERAINRTRPC